MLGWRAPLGSALLRVSTSQGRRSPPEHKGNCYLDHSILTMNLNEYDHIIVAFSGGKDSTACFLHLLDSGVDNSKIELWHHLIDGAPGSEPFMDWPITEDYCREFAKEFEVPIYFSWRDGGFLKEMLRDDDSTGKVFWENPDGTVESSGGNGPKGTRRKFPQVSADLRVRWCSAYLKIDVMSAAINNQERFKGKKTLVVTGERALESKSRSKYQDFEDHRCNGKIRTVHHWRPILYWDEIEVWRIIEEHDVLVHPAYQLGWSRLSCITCIFGNADQWASAANLYPDMVQKIADYEEEFGITIKRNKSVKDLVREGEVYNSPLLGHGFDVGIPDSEIISEIEVENIRNSKTASPDQWKLPIGAYGASDGPS